MPTRSAGCSVKEEALSRLILCGERTLRQVLTKYVTLFHSTSWPHQGKWQYGADARVCCPKPLRGRPRLSRRQRQPLGRLLEFIIKKPA